MTPLSNWNPEPRPCSECDEPFVPGSPIAKTCSAACNKVRQKRLGEERKVKARADTVRRREAKRAAALAAANADDVDDSDEPTYEDLVELEDGTAAQNIDRMLTLFARENELGSLQLELRDNAGAVKTAIRARDLARAIHRLLVGS